MSEAQKRTDFVFYRFSSILHDEQALQAVSKPLIGALEEEGGFEGQVDKASFDTPVLFFIETGGTEGSVLDFVRNTGYAGPVYLVAYSSNNSLPAALELAARFRQEGRPSQVVFLGSAGDEAGRKRVREIVDNLQVAYELRQSRLGLVGEPSDWLIASSPDAGTVLKTWGPELVNISMKTLYTAIDEADNRNAETAASSLAGSAVSIREPNRKELLDAAKVYLGLKQIVKEEALDAFTLRCFDLVVERKTTGCYALAKINDEGTIAGCEGDVVTALTMHWIKLLTGRLPWMANPAEIHSDDGRMVLAHCTVPFSLVKSFRLRSHFESSLGVGIQGEIPEGPVTLLRLGGSGLDRLWISEGVNRGMVNREDLCRSQVRIDVEAERAARVMTEPLGNHITLIQGSWARKIRESFLLLTGGELV
ncbi:MAG: hypothetical protein K9L68_01240 [Spirochaetales bacterium]|nr:hypothetical protein [Spirochaetales bacterium]